MAPGVVRLELLDGVAIITIDHPEVRNALSSRMVSTFTDLCARIDGDESIGATVVRGAGGTFCSGADTRAWTSDINDETAARTAAIYQLFIRFGSLATPTIAAVRGAAVGGGLNLALAADLRIVADDARLLPGFMRVGLHPGGGFFHLLGRTGGREVAAALGVFGEECSGSEAARRGIAWKSVDDRAVEKEAIETARKAAQDPALARQTIATMRAELGPPAVPWETAQEMERVRQLESAGRRRAPRST
jgi:enoyl-CoA hydratase